MDDLALDPSATPRPERPTRSRRPRGRVARAGASVLLAAALAWPAGTAHAVAEPAAGPAVETAAELAAQPVVQAAAELAAQPAAQAAAEPVAQAAAEPAAHAVAEPAGQPVVQAAADPAADPAAEPAADPAEQPAADPDSTGSLSGRVTDGSGAPLAGVTVRALGEDIDASVQTTADGTWRVADAPAGRYLVRFDLVDDGQRHVLFWNGTTYGTYLLTWGVTLAAGEDRSGLDVTFVDNVATGTVTASGAPVAGATVAFYRHVIDADPVQSVTTRADGTWTAAWLRPDSYEVRVTPPAGSGLAPAWWSPGDGQIGTLFFLGSTARTQAGIDVALGAESQLTGRVVDELGRPVADLPLTLWRGRTLPFASVNVTTAADGTYTFRGLDAGAYTVRVDPGYWWARDNGVVEDFLGGALTAREALWVEVGNRSVATVADHVMRLGGRVSGTVVAEPGWDGAGMSVEFLAADGAVVARVPAEDLTSNPDFQSPGNLPAGVYRVRAARADDGYWWVGGASFETARAITVRPRVAVTDLRLVLSDEFVGAPPALTQALTDANRAGLTVAAPVAPGGTAVVLGTEATSLSYVWLAPSLTGLGYVRTGADGTLGVVVPAGVAPGTYRLALTTAGGYVTGWADLTVVAAGSGAQPGSGGAPAAAAAPVPTATATAAARDAASRRPAQRSGALAATGFDGAWLAGGALVAVLLGAGLVVLRRRSA